MYLENVVVDAVEPQRLGRRPQVHPDWGSRPWQLHADPSGNEFCVLPARS